MAVARKYFERLLSLFSMGHPVRMIMYGMLIGVVAGLAAVAFFYLIELVQFHLFDGLCDYRMTKPRGEELFVSNAGDAPLRWLFFLLPVIGGLLAGFIVYRWAPEAEGLGTEAMISNFHHKRGVVRLRSPYLKALATICTLGTGGSVGRGGPISQIGAGLGSWLANLLHLGVRKRRILLLAGAAGGLGAIFRSPLGAAIIAVEVLYAEDIESEALIPCVISSVTAYTLFSSVFGFGRIFQIPEVAITSALELPFYLVLALVCIPAGILYVKLFHAAREKLFVPIRLSRFLKPALGGLLIGLIGLLVPEVYGTGWGSIQAALLGKLGLAAMCILVVAKMIASTLSLGSGGSGGILAPTLFIGGMIGGVVGGVGNLAAPEIVSQPHAFIMVGMAAFFAGVAGAPLGVLLMVCEITGGYNLIAPLLLVSMMAILFSRRYTIFPSQVKDKFHSPAHLGDVTFNVLEDIQVRACYRAKEHLPVFSHRMKLSQLPDWVRDSDVHIVLVSDKRGKVIGHVPGETLRGIPEATAMASLIILFDIMEKYRPIRLDDDLFSTLGQLRRYHQKVLPVVDEQDEPVGCIHTDDIMDAYAEEVFEKTRADDE